MQLSTTQLIATLSFSLALPTLSYFLNRRIAGADFRVCPYSLILTASSVFTLAIIAESIINPVYAYFLGQKLWEYRVLPLHDTNVSALAVFVWTAYGIHLYFLQQAIESRLPEKYPLLPSTALIIGIEAPFVFEVSGNSLFLLLTDQYYAYYLPGDVLHLTSFQVVPIYMASITLGVLVLAQLKRYGTRWWIPISVSGTGVVFLATG